MAAIRAPKQWSLTKTENITSFEAWRQNLVYTLSLDQNFAPFLVEGFTWLKKTAAAPLRGFADDDETVPEASRKTAAQKVNLLELMLGQIANYCPIISRNTIVKNSTSVNNIWQAIRLHYGFQSTGAHFLDFNSIHLEPGERPEDLFQRLNSFVEDNLLKAGGPIRHHGEIPGTDEDMSPSLENFVVLTWLRLIHSDLPNLVKQRYGTELRSQTLASLKPEISQALDSLLDEIHASAESKVLRSTFKRSTRLQTSAVPGSKSSRPSCPLCKEAGRRHDHYLSQCKYLPDSDKQYMSGKVRQACEYTDEQNVSEDEDSDFQTNSSVNLCSNTSRRVSTKQSPYLKVFYKHYPVQITLDSGAEISMIKYSVASRIGANIKKTNQSALQADGVTPLNILGETHLTLSRDNHSLSLEALVVNDLDVDVLAGIPFMTRNDISIRPAKNQITIGGADIVHYGKPTPDSPQNHVRRTQAFVLRTTSPSVVWPGSFIELSLPTDIVPDSSLTLEPRLDSTKPSKVWPRPQITEAVGDKIRIFNDSEEPQLLNKHDHFCQVRYTTSPEESPPIDMPCPQMPSGPVNIGPYSSTVSVDPDNILSDSVQAQFHSILHEYDEVFSPQIAGYNNGMGKFQATVNMGPVLPPQRKGRVPQYSRDKLIELQQKFDELEAQGVFSRPEDVNVTAEYLNPSFLVKKPNGGFRLVTAFSDVGRYSKPQPSLMPDVDSTLRTIAQWKYIVKTDLTNAFYQIPLAQQSMKFCGVATPFRGVRVYTRCAMGMPGSETALEELMCRVVGDFIQEGSVAKLADDLYIGGNTPDELLLTFKKVLQALQRCDLRLSPSKTVICPRSTTILGWIWSQGTLSASPHRVAVLAKTPPPETVHGLRSFIGAYKVLGRVLPKCSQLVGPLDTAVAGKQSSDKILWTDELLKQFQIAQNALTSHRSITLPQPSDQLWIVTDGSVSQHGIGATLYISRNDKLRLAGFFSAKLRKHQVTWLPCEIEALSISAAVKHFSPYIIQSKHTACVLTDSKPCVQAIDKLCRGQFSASPRVTSFLSTVSRYQVSVKHLKGSANIPSDFSSRNAPDCSEPNCQICKFIVETEDSVVRTVSVNDILNNTKSLPFTTRSAWIDIQAECPDLRRTHAHLKQGTRPSKKITNVKDVKRYLAVASIARDGLLVVPRSDPLQPASDLIIVPRSVLDGLATALHLRLDHPSKHQLLQVMKRHFYALDMPRAVDHAYDTCHTCCSLQKFPDKLIDQTSEEPPESVGFSFAADVLRRNRQLIFVLRETVTSYTVASLIDNERHETLREALARLVMELHPLDGPIALVRVDPAPGFIALKDDSLLQQLRINIEVGRVKNVNKNPVAERAVQELEEELLRQEPGGGAVNQLDLSIAIARLNARIRFSGLSSRELWTQRSQFTHEQLPISDRDIIVEQYQKRSENHPTSSLSKHKSGKSVPTPSLNVGDSVYLYTDKDKSRARDRYLVVSVDGEWCRIKKFVGNQLRATSYKVKVKECYKVPSDFSASTIHGFSTIGNHVDNEEDEPLDGPSVPHTLTEPIYLSSCTS